MRIAIASTGRFHVLDLARELAMLGHDVRFYSYVPKDRAVAFGLPAECHRSLTRAALPFLMWERAFGQRWRDARVHRMHRALNAAVIKRLEPCDAFICMSGVYLEAAEYARKRFGALVYLERGSMHVDAQDEILRAAGARPIAVHTLERERAGYALADRIVIPSSHVAQSFERDHALAAKTFANPYGVDLDMFPQRDGPPPHPRRVLFVGNWSYQKGVDVLCEAMRQLQDCELVHVGALRDVPLPDDPWFTHHDPVEQRELTKFYQSASVFAMSSRQEGLALVQAQALASGLPLVCTTMTGGADLAHSPALSDRIHVVPPSDPVQLATGLRAMLERVRSGQFERLAPQDRGLLSWRGYGERYSDELERSIEASEAPHSAHHDVPTFSGLDA